MTFWQFVEQVPPTRSCRQPPSTVSVRPARARACRWPVNHLLRFPARPPAAVAVGADRGGERFRPAQRTVDADLDGAAATRGDHGLVTGRRARAMRQMVTVDGRRHPFSSRSMLRRSRPAASPSCCCVMPAPPRSIPSTAPNPPKRYWVRAEPYLFALISTATVHAIFSRRRCRCSPRVNWSRLSVSPT